MGPTIITLLYFSALIAGTFLLHRLSKAGKNAMPKTMTVLPKVLGGIMCLLTLISLALNISLVKEYSIHLGFFFSLIFLASRILIMIFFMRLNNISQSYSMPSLAGIAGCVASILGTGTGIILFICEFMDIEGSTTTNNMDDLWFIFGNLSLILMIAAAGILCGNVSRFNKTSMTACIILLVSLVIGWLSSDLADFVFDGYTESFRYTDSIIAHAPFVGWIILFFMFKTDNPTPRAVPTDIYNR